MADNVTITQGSGTDVAADEIAGIKHQRVKIQYGADGSATDVSSVSPLPITGTVTGITNTVAIYFSGSNPAVNVGSPTITGITNSIAIVPFTGSGSALYDETVDAIKIVDGGNVISVDDGASSLTVDGTVTANAGTGTLTIRTDPGYELGSIKGINSSINIYLGATAGTLVIKMAPETGLPASSNNIGDVDVLTLPSLPAGTNNIGDVDVLTLPALPAGTNNIGDVDVLSLPAIPTGTNSIGTIAVFFQPSEPTIKVKDTYATSIISGTISGSMVATNTTAGIIINAEAAHNVKIYALALTTTAQVQTVVKFAGHQTEIWRYALQAPTAGIAGANLSVSPPGYLFASGIGNSLSIFGDSGSLFHYSIGYFKESA